MKDTEIPCKVTAAMYKQCRRRGYAAPVDVLMDLGVLSQKDYNDWRNGKVDYLERVCHANLSKLSKIMRAMRSCAQKSGFKPSVTVYHRWGKHRKQQLRFSKSGSPDIERNYSTHYVSLSAVVRIKAEKEAKLERPAESTD